MDTFTSGALMIAHWVVALFFLKFFRATSDRLFGFFATAFFLLGVERIVLFATRSTEIGPYVYLIRLLAFSLIIYSFLDKNRKPS